MGEFTGQQFPAFTWRAHPARERFGLALLGATLILAVGGVIFLMVRADGASLTVCSAWATLSVVILALALNRFFLPSRFSIDEQGITAWFPLRRRRFRWADIRRFVHDANGGYLSTRTRRSRLDAYTGLHILFGTRDREVIEQIRNHLDPGED
ncbi:MAG: hypothetical protein JSV91_06755 [Phycisphaerales bacterium]|nr:MAG: hypothetical protein JSV91_06755 [Phycisphaerales bacterium]